jgi:hypothetical protein
MTEKRRELVFQSHILDSYANCGGYARKWASEWQVGVPDLICTLPDIGCHLVEVKHRPLWLSRPVWDNPLEPKQREICKDYMKGGAIVFVGVISGGSKTTVDARLHVYPAYMNRMHVDMEGPSSFVQGVPYVGGKKFAMRTAINMALKGYDTDFARSGVYFRAED